MYIQTRFNYVSFKRVSILFAPCQRTIFIYKDNISQYCTWRSRGEIKKKRRYQHALIGRAIYREYTKSLLVRRRVTRSGITLLLDAHVRRPLSPLVTRAARVAAHVPHVRLRQRKAHIHTYIRRDPGVPR